MSTFAQDSTASELHQQGGAGHPGPNHIPVTGDYVQETLSIQLHPLSSRRRDCGLKRGALKPYLVTGEKNVSGTLKDIMMITSVTFSDVAFALETM